MKKLLLALLAIGCLGLGACSNPNCMTGIQYAYINESGHLILVYTDGSDKDLGNVKGEQGEPGANGQDGKDGTDGTNGSNGQDGVSIVSITLTSSDGLVDTYTITYSDGHTSTFTVTNGKDGEDGQDGADGAVVEITKKYNITIDNYNLTVGTTYEYLAITNAQASWDHTELYKTNTAIMAFITDQNINWETVTTYDLSTANHYYKGVDGTVSRWKNTENGIYLLKNAEVTYNQNGTFAVEYEVAYTPLELLILGE